MKLKDLPPPDLFYKEPETLTSPEKAEILSKIKEIAERYRAARQKSSLRKKEPKT